MIEQTEFIVTEWHYYPPERVIDEKDFIEELTSLDVQKKRASTKKGIAFRFSCRFTFGNKIILNYVGEDSYVIDFDEVIDEHELLTMIRNSFSKFKDKFDLRKLATVLQNRSLRPLDESMINIVAILPLLV
ncbi:MAG: hypothetical protein ABIW47_11440 [Ginsengibacter sp.]|jgi:hypothetical protein